MRAASEGRAYEAEADFTDGSTEIQAGETVVDVLYYERASPEAPLDFHPQERATVRVGQLLRAELDVQAAAGRGRRSTRSQRSVSLAHESSVRVMQAWAEEHPSSARRVI